MSVVTTCDPGANEWRIYDDVVQLREWGTDQVHPLPPRTGAWDIGTEEGCWLRLDDRRVSGRHARLMFELERWLVTDLQSKNGVRQDGERRPSFPLAPGVELGIGGTTLIAESPRFVELRGVLSRMIGWSDARRADVDLALRTVRMAAAHRDSMLLCGDGDLISIAHLLHRHALGDDRPFVVCDSRRRSPYPSGLLAMAAAIGGTLCVWQNRPPADYDAVVARVRDPDARVQLVICTHVLLRLESLIASPIVLPPLAERAGELERLIDELGADAVAAVGTGATFTPADHDWIRRHEAATFAQIESATRRLVAIRAAGGSLTRAAAQLGVSHAVLSEWVARRALPE